MLLRKKEEKKGAINLLIIKTHYILLYKIKKKIL